MPTPILPMASHGSRPTSVAGTDMNTVDAMVGQTNAQEPLNEQDFAYLAEALRDPKRAGKAEAFLSGKVPNKQNKLISGAESKAFEDYLNMQNVPNGTDKTGNRVDSNMLSVKGVGVTPEDALGAGQVARGIAGAVKMAPAGAKALAGAGRAALEASPVIKYELTKHGLQAVGGTLGIPVPDAISIPIAMAVSGYGGKGKAATGGAKVKAEPPSLNEQLGVSPTATGATMDSLPDTPVPAGARTALPLAHSTQSTADAAAKARGEAASLGVAGADVPDNMPLGVGDETRTLAVGSREPIPVPVRLRDNPKPKTVSSFEDIARELGLDTTHMVKEPPMAVNHAPSPAAKGALQTSGLMRGAPEVRMPSEGQMDTLTGKLGGMEPPPGLSPTERSKWVQQELMKELMSRESFRTMGTGSRKRGEGYGKPPVEE